MPNVRTIAEAAADLNVSRQRIQQWIADGRLRATKRGGIWLISARSIARLDATPRPRGRPRKDEQA